MRFEHPSRAPAVAALLAGAVVWVLVWYPYRLLQSAGMSGVLASGLTYLVALLLGLIALRGAWRRCRPSWLLLPIGLAAGGCNLGYVLATLHGEVMRVLLLFYLSPLWTVLLAHMLLGEHLNRAGTAIVALSLAGAVDARGGDRAGVGVPVRPVHRPGARVERAVHRTEIALGVRRCGSARP